MSDINPPLPVPPPLRLVKGPIVAPPAPPVDRLELAAKAAFDRHVAQKIADGCSISARWEEQPDALRAAWRGVTQAAVEAWDASR